MGLLFNKKSLCALAAGLFVSMISATEALAAPIAGLYSTGVDNAGVVRPTNTGLADLHYTVTTPGYILNDARWGSPWLPNTATAGWTALFYASNGGWSWDAGTYQITTSFTLAANEDPLTAFFTANVASDNYINQILLNGSYVGNALSGLGTFNTLNVNNYFQTGVNTLRFDVTNAPGYWGGNPAGLIVDIMSSGVSTITPPVVTAPVPEPETWAMLLAGLGLLGFAARRRTAHFY